MTLKFVFIFSLDGVDRSGDWAGNVWSTAGAPGQEQSCAQRTGFATCADFVQNSGSSFAQACES